MTGPGAVLERSPDDRVRVLDADGTVVDAELVPDLDDETLVSMYRDMRFSRRFDERAVSLQRQGRLGTYPPLAGQEGAQVGSTYALSATDLVAFQYREHGAIVARGLPWEYLRYWAGHESGNAALADLDVFPLNIAIGSHLPHVVGLAWGADHRGDGRVVVGHFGDGATSQGDFHESLNFAGVFDLPAVFLCHNNGWAISMPRADQTASETIAQKAAAYGFEGVQVDGMDPLATYVVTKAAREKAADAAGDRSRPTLIEAVQYRFGAHTTADDPSVYRTDDEVEAWRRRDPIPRLEAFLRETGRLDDEAVESIDGEIEAAIAAAVERAEAGEADPDDIFDFVYAEPTERVEEGKASLRELRERHGDDALLRDE